MDLRDKPRPSAGMAALPCKAKLRNTRLEKLEADLDEHARRYGHSLAHSRFELPGVDGRERCLIQTLSQAGEASLASTTFPLAGAFLTDRSRSG